MIKILRTESRNPDFIALVKYLDEELAERDGEDHSFYDVFNKIDTLKYVVLIYEDEKPVACGAIKEYEPSIMEVKRMFTLTKYRGKGLAGLVLKELEKWAAESGYQKCILETGKKQPEAIRLYQKSGYTFIPNYGQYQNIENSVCFEKQIHRNN